MRFLRNGFIAVLALLVFTQAHIAVHSPGIEFALVQEADANACTYGGVSGNWGTAGTWTNCGGVAPTSADTCAISGTGTLTVESSVSGTDVCGNTDFTGFTGTLAQTGTHELDIYGSLTIVSGMTYAPANTTVLKFKGTAGPYTIKSGGKTMGPTTFDGVGGSWVWGDAWSMQSSAVPNTTVTNGSFDTGNFNGTNIALSSNNSNTRSITLGTSTISLPAANGTIWDLGTTTGLTFSAASSTITINNASSTNTFAGGGLTYGTVQNTGLTTGTVTITGANTIGTLTLNEGSSVGTFSGYGYLIAATQTVSGTCTFNGTSQLDRDWIQSSVKGTARTISCATVSSNGANFSDITAAGAGNWNISGQSAGSGDLGGNTGITFDTPKTCYMVNGGNSVNFSAANWKTSSGGSTNCTPTQPLPQDTAIVDSTGWTGASKSLTIDAGQPWLPSINTSAAPAGMTLTFTGNGIYTRALTLGSSHSISGTGQITFDGSGTRTINFTTAGQTMTPKIAIFGAPTLTVQQQDNLTDNRAVAEALAIGSGTASCCGIWDQNGHTITTTGSGSDVGLEGGTLLYSANITGTAFVFQYNSGITSHMTPKTGYYQTDLTNTVMTVTTLPASGGSSTFGN